MNGCRVFDFLCVENIYDCFEKLIKIVWYSKLLRDGVFIGLIRLVYSNYRIFVVLVVDFFGNFL